MVPHVSKLDLIIAISNTILNSKGATASPLLSTLLTLNSEDKCLPVLTILLVKVPELHLCKWYSKRRLSKQSTVVNRMQDDFNLRPFPQIKHVHYKAMYLSQSKMNPKNNTFAAKKKYY